MYFSRSVEKNRIKAKEKLLEALDNHLNQENSVAAQLKRIEKFREERTNAKRKKRREEKLRAKLELEGKLKIEESSEESDTKKDENSQKVGIHIGDQSPEEKKP